LAWAEVDREGGEASSWHQVVQESASQGAFLPMSMTATVASRAGLVTSVGGYDGARRAGIAEAATEVRVWGPLALRGGATYSDLKNQLRPSIGARLQLLGQGRHGIDGAVGVFYRSEGFTEPEGEIETVISIGRRMGRTTMVGNLAYGQDPEGRERDGEVRAAVLRQLGTRVHAGLDGRWRLDLGSDVAKLKASAEPTFDMMAGFVTSVAIGPVALTALAGVSVVRMAGASSTSTGAIALGGIGTAL
jgi:hypothetical protein